jgi:hypothetical protein
MAVPTNIRVNAQFPFPATVTGSGPVSVTKQSGVWTVAVNVAQLTQQVSQGLAAGLPTLTPALGSDVLITNPPSTQLGLTTVSAIGALIGGGGGTFPYVNVMTYGADPTGVADSSAAFQAAIDAAYNAGGPRTIFAPHGKYKWTLPVYLDPPGNLRGSAAAWAGGTTYSSGQIVKYNGIQWTSQLNANLNNPPTLPPKVIAGTNYNTGDMVEFYNKYWTSNSNSNPGNNLIYGWSGFQHAPTGWTNVPVWWLPSVATVSIISWAPTLVGELGQGGGGGCIYGTIIRPTFNNTPALIVGSQQGSLVSSLQIEGPSSSSWNDYRITQPNTGAGIAIAGGSGGSSRAMFDMCEVDNFYVGILDGFNVDGLGDNNHFRRCYFVNCGICVNISKSQNFIHTFDDCSMFQCTNGVWTGIPTGTNACPVQIFGGNWSQSDTKGDAWTISGTTAPTFSGGGGIAGQVSFSTTIHLDASVDAFNKNQRITLGVYNAFALVTAHYGIVPLNMTAFNPATGVASFQTTYAFAFYFFDQNVLTSSDFGTEIQACTTLYSVELGTTFLGVGFNIRGIHIENNFRPMTLLTLYESFGQTVPSRIDGMFCDGDISGLSYAPVNTSDPNLNSFYYIAKSFPTFNITLGSGNLEIVNSTWSQDQLQGNDPIIIDVQNVAYRLTFRGNSTAGPVCVRVTTGQPGYTNSGSMNAISSPYLGAGEWDVPPLYALPYQNGAPGYPDGGVSFLLGWGRSPFWGVRPAPWARPFLLPFTGSLLSGTLPAIVPTGSGGGKGGVTYNVPYPIMWGGQIYSQANWDGTVNPGATEIISRHKFYTYGQQLTTTNVPNLSWNYKGGSWVVNCNQELMRLIFAGCQIKLNNGSGDVLYMVTGVYPGAGYITVGSGTDNTSRLAGTAGTLYSGTTIEQDPFQITQVPQNMDSLLGSASNPLTLMSDSTVASGGSHDVVVVAGGNTVASQEVARFLHTGNVQFTNTANFSANGAVATALTSIGPTGSRTTVQKWLTVKDSAGNPFYIPCF